MTSLITRTTIESASYNNIFEFMNNRSNIADPRGGSAENRPFIYDSDPLHKSLSFANLPYIVLEFPTIEYSRMSHDGKHKFIMWTQRIIVRTARDGSGGNLIDTGRTDMFAISDDLQELFNSTTQRDEFRLLNIKKINLTKLDSDTISIDQKQMYETVYELQYQSRLTVSS